MAFNLFLIQTHANKIFIIKILYFEYMKAIPSTTNSDFISKQTMKSQNGINVKAKNLDYILSFQNFLQH